MNERLPGFSDTTPQQPTGVRWLSPIRRRRLRPTVVEVRDVLIAASFLAAGLLLALIR